MHCGGKASCCALSGATDARALFVVLLFDGILELVLSSVEPGSLSGNIDRSIG